MSGNRTIPVCEPLLAGNELAYVTEAVSSGWISSGGSFVQRFEEAFAGFVGVSHGVSTTSGTTALHLGLVALGISPGDEVILPSFTMAACGFAVVYTGATPVFVDVEPGTWTIDPEAVEVALSSRTRAIMPVHIFGLPADMDRIAEIALGRDIAIIEDAAEAHGATIRGTPVGSLGACAAFSFYGNKNLTTGEGGMVVTDSAAVAERLRYHRNMCFPLGDVREYRHDDIGFNYRMSNLHAAVGLAQVERAAHYTQLRVEHGERYRERLGNVDGLELQEHPDERNSVHWMNAVVLADDVDLTPSQVGHELLQRGIETRRLFEGLHRQRAFAPVRRLGSSSFAVTDRLARRGFYLPSGSSLAESDIDNICDVLVDVLGSRA